MDSFNKTQLGKIAEEQARTFLEIKGLRLINQNYFCYFGEIDLVMQDKNAIVFVEVRSRSRADYGSALESVTKSKQKKLIKTATHYLQKKKWLYKVNSRFDIITIDTINQEIQLNWIKNAFMA